MVRFTILATSDGTEPCIDELEVYTAPNGEATPARNVALATAGGTASASSEYPDSPIHKIAHLNDGRHGNGRSWISRSPGKGVVTIAWPEPATIDRVVWGRDREGVYRDRLATQYYIEVATEPGRWRVVASSADRVAYAIAAEPARSPRPAARPSGPDLLARQAELRERLAELGATMKVYAGTFSQPGPTYLLVRGDPTRRGRRSPRRRSRASGRGWCSIPAPPRPSAGPRWRAGWPTRPTRCRPG